MENNTNLTATGGNNNPVQGNERTFSQDEVNHIVGERLAKEKIKSESDFMKKEQELAARELRISAKELLTEKGLPVQLLDALNCTSKEALNKSVDILQVTINQIEGERSTFTIKGAVPANGREEADEPADLALRKAMGLRK